MDLQVILAIAGVSVAITGWLANALFTRLQNTLDRMMQRLDRISELQAAHGARLDALERIR